MKEKTPRWPVHGWIGIFLVGIFWILNWSMDGLRTHFLFFPLWLGYCLIVDAIAVRRKGHSLLTRNRRQYISLFFISVPVWWLFELFNLSTQNWYYEGRQFFSDFEYALFASLNFSTVMPAVFGTTEVVATFKGIQKSVNRTRLLPTPAKNTLFIICGIIMLTLLFTWPHYFYVFMWTSVVLIIEPVNYRLGYHSLLNYFARGDWRPLWALWSGVLICGFFWEMWNFFSYPRWIYQVPFVNFWHIFEMPLIGYLGYLPFALELFGLFHFISGLLNINQKLNLFD
jgi:hypothetical protein